MADMPGDFWGGYIAGITVLGLIALAWLVYNVYFTKGSDAEVAEHRWDDDLREGIRPAPLWWFWMILSLLAFSVIYLMLYPGLGRFSGVLEWSQGGEVEAARARFASEFGAERARIAATPAGDLAANPAALRSGGHLFRVHCGACHGADAGGQSMLFPNLSDAAWQWGGSEAEIEQTIRGGRTAVMPPLQAALQDEGVAAMAEYTLALAAGRADAPELADARVQFTQLCGACHGPDGAGNTLLGAPALNDSIWLYGGDYEAVRSSIANGRNGSMPAFAGRLDATQIRLLTAWLVAGADSVALDD